MAGQAGFQQQSFTDDNPGNQMGTGPLKEVDRTCDNGKLFIGGLSWETSTEKLIAFMSKFGEVEAGEVKIDNDSGRSRGFGFIKFCDPNVAESVLNSGPHEIDGKTIDPKKATKFGKPQGAIRTKKIFVGGLKQETTEEALREYFQFHSPVHSIDFVLDSETKRKRGFCFIELDSEDVVDDLVKKQFHEVAGKTVEVKYAFTREQQAQMAAKGRGRGGGRGSGGPGGQGMFGRGRGGGGYDNAAYGSPYGAYGGGPAAHGASYGQVGGYGASSYSSYYGAPPGRGYAMDSSAYGNPYAGYNYGGSYGAAGAGATGVRDVGYPDMSTGRGAATGYRPMSSYTRNQYHPYAR